MKILKGSFGWLFTAAAGFVAITLTLAKEGGIPLIACTTFCVGIALTNIVRNVVDKLMWEEVADDGAADSGADKIAHGGARRHVVSPR